MNHWMDGWMARQGYSVLDVWTNIAGKLMWKTYIWLTRVNFVI